MHTDMVTSYVRDLLERLTGDRPEPDHDDDLVVQFRGAKFHVHVINPVNPIVQVFTVVLDPVEPTPEVLAALNEMNQNLSFARAFQVAGQLLIETEIWGEDINANNFGHACWNIAAATDFFGPKLAEQFGGQLRFEDAKSDDYNLEKLASSGGYGHYL